MVEEAESGEAEYKTRRQQERHSAIGRMKAEVAARQGGLGRLPTALAGEISRSEAADRELREACRAWFDEIFKR